MGQPLSIDLRSRLIAAIDDGMSCRAAAARFGVAPSTAIRWHAQRRDVGHFEPKSQGGDMRSHHVEKRAADILALWEANRDITLEELRAELSEIGLEVSIAGLHRFFKRHGMTWKKRPGTPSSRTARIGKSAPRNVVGDILDPVPHHGKHASG